MAVETELIIDAIKDIFSQAEQYLMDNPHLIGKVEFVYDINRIGNRCELVGNFEPKRDINMEQVTENTRKFIESDSFQDMVKRQNQSESEKEIENKLETLEDGVKATVAIEKKAALEALKQIRIELVFEMDKHSLKTQGRGDEGSKATQRAINIIDEKINQINSESEGINVKKALD